MLVRFEEGMGLLSLGEGGGVGRGDPAAPVSFGFGNGQFDVGGGRFGV